MKIKATPINVLLVDDEPALLRGLIRGLSEHNFQIQTAICAAEAQVVLDRFAIDVVVCDYNMPGMQGLEFLATVRSERPDLVLMLLSGQVAELPVAKKWAEDVGIHKVLAKPCSADELAQDIQIAIQSIKARESFPSCD